MGPAAWRMVDPSWWRYSARSLNGNFLFTTFHHCTTQHRSMMAPSKTTELSSFFKVSNARIVQSFNKFITSDIFCPSSLDGNTDLLFAILLLFFR